MYPACPAPVLRPRAVLLGLVILCLSPFGDTGRCDETPPRRADKKARAHSDKGMAHYRAKRYDKAIAELTKAIKLEPENAYFFKNRGMAYRENKEIEKAIADFDQAVRLSPKYAAAYHERGKARFQSGEYERAVADYSEAIKLSPNHTTSYEGRAQAYRKLGKKDLADADQSAAQRLELDLIQAMEKAGFSDVRRSVRVAVSPPAKAALNNQVEQYVRFGSAALARKAMAGAPLERVDAEDKAKGHRRKVAAQPWRLTDLPVIVPKENNEKYAADGLLAVVCIAPLRIAVNPKDEDSRFSDSLSRLHASWASDANMWFLTKDGTLRECKALTEVLAVKKAGGILYIPEGKTTELVLILSLNRSAALSIVRQPADYKVDLTFDGLEYRQAFDWGLYRKDKLIEADWSSQSLIDWNSTGAFGDVKAPHYFRPAGLERPNLVCATLLSAVLKDKAGKALASYRREPRPKK